MINITRSSANTVVLTLTENTTIDSPTYLFTLKKENNQIVKSFIAVDVSSYTERYNKFIITEVGDGGVENLLTGNIELSKPGRYVVEIRQQTSSSNLNPDLSGSIVEKDIMTVLEDEVERTSYTTTKNIYTYKPQ